MIQNNIPEGRPSPHGSRGAEFSIDGVAILSGDGDLLFRVNSSTASFHGVRHLHDSREWGARLTLHNE